MSRLEAVYRDRFPLIAALFAVSVVATGCAADGGEPPSADAGSRPPSRAWSRNSSRRTGTRGSTTTTG